MTIETTTNRISYTGSGTTGPFSFPYYFLADGDLTVIKTTIADGTEETLTITTDYTVSGAGEAAGGSVTLVATLSSSYKLTIIRDPDILQPADYPANDRFPSATHEEALDRATMIMQRLNDLIDRSFRLSDGDVSGISLILSNLVAGELIAVNAAGTGIESIAAADVDLATVTLYIQTLLDDADAATARTTLGAAATGANTFTGLQQLDYSSDIASAATVDLGTATGNSVTVTHSSGTTAITSFGGAATAQKGTIIAVIPSISGGTLTVTHHATNMILLGGANITLASGDVLLMMKNHDSNAEWKHVGGCKADGTAWVTSTSGMPRSYLAGLGISNNGTDATNDIDVAVGACRDSTNSADIVLASALTKQLDATWSVGTNQGGLDTGSIANAVYHVWAIKRSDTGVVDVLFSLSATAPTMPTNYDYKRRIGSVIRSAGAILAFTQKGDRFLLNDPPLDINTTTLGGSTTAYVLTVPTGVSVDAILNLYGIRAAGNAAVYIHSPSNSSEAASVSAAPLATFIAASTGAVLGQVIIGTDTSGQVNAVSQSASTTLLGSTLGWFDTRGKEA